MLYNQHTKRKFTRKALHTAVLVAIMVVGASALASCSAITKRNQQYVPEAVQHGNSITDKSVQRYLMGQIISSDQDIQSAKSQYSRAGDFCNVARLYIVQFQARGLDNVSFIDNANDFAQLGNCEEELNIVRFVHGEDYSEKQLPEFYRLLSKYDQGDYSHEKFVKSLMASKKLRAFTQTAGVRLAVGRMLNDPTVDSKLTESYITQILIPADEAFSYTTNIKKDYDLLAAVYRQQGRDPEKILRTIDLIDNEINYVK